jgi:uncharacterized protein
MGILGNLFGQSEDGMGSDFGMKLMLAGQVLQAMDQGQVANIAPAVAAMQDRRRRIADQMQQRKWLQNQAAGMADKNPRLAQMLQDAPPEVGASLISEYYKTLLAPPQLDTFTVGGNVYRGNPNDPNAQPELWIQGPGPKPETVEVGGALYRMPTDPGAQPELLIPAQPKMPDGEMAQYLNDQKMREAQGLPPQLFGEWKQTTLAPKGPADWENKYTALVADMKQRGVPEDQIPTLSEFLDDGLKIVTSPDGSVSVTQGGAASTARPTEGDYRAKQIAQSIAPDIPEAIQGFDKMSSFAGTIDGLGATFLNDEDSQAAMDAIKNVATQAVYAISGAGTTENEMQNKIASMVPAPGDKPKTLKNKKRRLAATIKSMTDRAGLAPSELGFDPALFDAPAETTAPPAADAAPKVLKWDPEKGLSQ